MRDSYNLLGGSCTPLGLGIRVHYALTTGTTALFDALHLNKNNNKFFFFMTWSVQLLLID